MAFQIHPRQCGSLSLFVPSPLSQPLIESVTLIPSPSHVFIADSLHSFSPPLLTPLADFIPHLIYTPTHCPTHFLLTLILLSLFIYLFHPVLSLPDFINTPPLSILSPFFLWSSLSSPRPSALPSHQWMMRRCIEGLNQRSGALSNLKANSTDSHLRVQQHDIAAITCGTREREQPLRVAASLKLQGGMENFLFCCYQRIQPRNVLVWIWLCWCLTGDGGG